uniref:Sialoadhesin-like isoform X4 n=1 Tax=Petromyzon marinus TaxID=7757 RepID=A0AAJ7TS00_PETMA|nr:sialoadhesin-like isoform X4 [Petromyzon marinus]
MDTETRRRAVWMSVVICILSRITSVHLQASPREYFVAVGQEVTLTCDRNTPGWSQHDNPNISSITWRRGEGNGAPDMDLTNSRDFRITVIKDVDQHRVSIRIANVQHSDAGVYRCLVKSEVGTESPMMEIITMEVSANPSSVVSEGETVTLTCHISNSAYVQSIVWTHGGTEMNPRNSVLTLHKVKRCQEGAWTCGVKTQTDQASASHHLTVSSQNVCDVKAPAPRKYFVSVGQTVILPCVEDDPEFKWKDHPSSDLALTWRWERQGSGSETIVQYPKQTGQRYGDVWKNTAIPLVSRITTLKSNFDKDNFSIQISKVQHSDAGLYICHFAGYFRTSSLTRELITMQVSANPSRSVTEGETVTLTCLISNSGYGTVLVWYHGDIYIDQGNSVLILNKVKRSQQGQWKCAIHDQQNSPFASYKLQFRSTGSHVEKAPAVQKYFIHEGGEVSLSCDESDPGFQWKDHSQQTRAVTWKWRSHDGTTQRYDQNIQYPSQLSDYRDQFPLTLSLVTFSSGGVYTCEFTGYYRTGTLTMELVTMKGTVILSHIN